MIIQSCGVKAFVVVSFLFMNFNVYGMAFGGSFQDTVFDELGKFGVKIVGTALLSMVDESVKLYRWSYNKLFPHVENIHKGLIRIDRTINEIDKKVGGLSDTLKKEAHDLIDKIAHLPNKKDAESKLVILHQVLLQEQQKCTTCTNSTMAEVEERLKEQFAVIEDSLGDKTKGCRQKVEVGHVVIRQAQQEVKSTQLSAEQKITDILKDNNQILEALPGYNLKQAMVQDAVKK